MQELIGSLDALKSTDPETYEAIVAEEQRQRDKLLLIASENFASPAVLAAQGSVMTNKYAEGYPGKRYYGGCQHVDTVESLAIERAKQIFGAEHVNVQPHSGSQANMAAYLSVLKPGEPVTSHDRLPCHGRRAHQGAGRRGIRRRGDGAESRPSHPQKKAAA